jgi:hypothetical protein
VGKLTVYIHSFEVGTVDFVDKEGAMHACAQAQSTAFQRLAQFSGLFGNTYLCDEDRETLARVEEFCKANGLEYTIVDLGKLGRITRLRLRMKGIRTPTVCCGNVRLSGIPSDQDLRQLSK